MKRLYFFLYITVALASLSQAQSNDKPTLCQGLYHSEAEAVEQLKRIAMTHSNLSEWKARAAAVQQQILTGAKLSPLPKRTPLNPIIKNKRRYDGYTVEAAAFEARPGFFVYGNLYRPLGHKGKRPGVLCPHGHACGPTSKTAVPRSHAWVRWCSRTT